MTGGERLARLIPLAAAGHRLWIQVSAGPPRIARTSDLLRACELHVELNRRIERSAGSQYVRCWSLGDRADRDGGGDADRKHRHERLGGPRRRIYGVLGFIGLGGIGLAIAGLHPLATVIAAGGFLLLFCVPLASGSSQAIFQSKVAPAVQGRVFAIRTLISRSMLPLAYASAGPLADRLFEPMLRDPASALSRTIGAVIGTGPGRGMGLMFILGGVALLAATAAAYANPRIRHIEDELPDAISSIPETALAGGAVAAEA